MNQPNPVGWVGQSGWLHEMDQAVNISTVQVQQNGTPNTSALRINHWRSRPTRSTKFEFRFELLRHRRLVASLPLPAHPKIQLDSPALRAHRPIARSVPPRSSARPQSRLGSSPAVTAHSSSAQGVHKFWFRHWVTLHPWPPLPVKLPFLTRTRISLHFEPSMAHHLSLSFPL